MILRDYQKRASDAVLEQWREQQSTLVVMPTGSGKTILFADIIRRMHPQRSLVLCHRQELIWQARDKIEKTTGLDCQIEMAHLNAHSNRFFTEEHSPVVISTIQTQIAGRDGLGRMAKFDPMQFGCLIIDESHHATAGSYGKVLDYYKQNPDLRILGVTATPDRADEEALGKIFQTVAFDYEILDAIHDGWLVPIDQQMVHIEGLDFSQIRTTAGDLNGADLAAVMEQEKNLHGIASSSLEIIGDRRTLVFTASVKQAEILCNIFNRHKPDMAAWICGKTPQEERVKLLSRFSDGTIQVMVNCSVLTEGFDNPGVEVVIQAKPTKSRSLYAQMIGRSTRPLAGVVDGLENSDERKQAIENSPKKNCLIVDFCGNSGKHKLVTSADILGGNVSDEAIAKATKRAEKENKPVRMSDILEEEEKKLREQALFHKQQEEARKAKLVAKAKYSTQTVNPFDIFNLSPVKERGWDSGKELSVKQRDLLLKQGVNPDGMPHGQAQQLLNEMFRRWKCKLATLGQCKQLKRFGYETNVSFSEASKIIDAIAKNGWKRPAEPISPEKGKELFQAMRNAIA